MVYVDDFKMAGPLGQMAGTRKELSSRIQMDDPGPVTKCLGCHHHIRLGVAKGMPVQIIEYDMGDFMLVCVEAYRKAVGEPNMVPRAVDTPFLDIDEEEEPTGNHQPIASLILMKLFYGARIARWD